MTDDLHTTESSAQSSEKPVFRLVPKEPVDSTSHEEKKMTLRLKVEEEKPSEKNRAQEESGESSRTDFSENLAAKLEEEPRDISSETTEEFRDNSTNSAGDNGGRGKPDGISAHLLRNVILLMLLAVLCGGFGIFWKLHTAVEEIEHEITAFSNGEYDMVYQNLSKVTGGKLISFAQNKFGFCRERVGRAYLYLGYCLSLGYGVEQNTQQALEKFGKATELGNDESWFGRADCLLRNMSDMQSVNTAVEDLKKAESLGVEKANQERYITNLLSGKNETAQTTRAFVNLCYLNKNIPAEAEKSFGLLKSACWRISENEVLNRAYYLLGYCYAKGIGTPQNFSLAVDFWKNCPYERAKLAFAIGVIQERFFSDLKQAKEYYDESARLGYLRGKRGQLHLSDFASEEVNYLTTDDRVFDGQRKYEQEIVEYRASHNYDIKEYLSQLATETNEVIENEKAKYPSEEEMQKIAEKLYADKRQELQNEISARYSGAALVKLLEEMTKSGKTYPPFGDFSVIRRVTPSVDWSKWEKFPTSNMKDYLEEIKNDYAKAAFESLGGEAKIKQIGEEMEAKYKLYKEGSFISLNLISGSMANRTINRMVLTKILSDGIILSNGVRRVLKSDISIEDQARIFPSVHEQYVRKLTEKEKQLLQKQANEMAIDRLEKTMKELLLDNGYVPNPASSYPTSHYVRVSQVHNCWISMRELAENIRKILSKRDWEQEMEPKLSEYMLECGYIENTNENFGKKAGRMKHTGQIIKQKWIHKDLQKFYDFCVVKFQELNEALADAIRHQEKGEIPLWNDDVVVWTTPQKAFITECQYIREVMLNAGFEPEEYRIDVGYWVARYKRLFDMPNYYRRGKNYNALGFLADLKISAPEVDEESYARQKIVWQPSTIAEDLGASFLLGQDICDGAQVLPENSRMFFFANNFVEVLRFYVGDSMYGSNSSSSKSRGFWLKYNTLTSDDKVYVELVHRLSRAGNVGLFPKDILTLKEMIEKSANNPVLVNKTDALLVQKVLSTGDSSVHGEELNESALEWLSELRNALSERRVEGRNDLNRRIQNSVKEDYRRIQNSVKEDLGF